jgi:glycerol-3-phosphate dehydrogenase
LTGVLFSRTGVAWSGRMTAQSIRLAAMAMAPLLSWNEELVESEIDNFRTYLRVHHRYEVDRT